MIQKSPSAQETPVTDTDAGQDQNQANVDTDETEITDESSVPTDVSGDNSTSSDDSGDQDQPADGSTTSDTTSEDSIADDSNPARNL